VVVVCILSILLLRVIHIVAFGSILIVVSLPLLTDFWVGSSLFCQESCDAAVNILGLPPGE
jgi:uncharacterized membrane protein